jgi:hypothetical protein
MRRAEHIRVTSFVTLGLLAAFGMRPALAEETTCVGMLVGITVDNLRVPSGRICTLDAIRVKGTLKVERDATLYARQVHVVGNVQAENAKQVSVTSDSTVGGSIQIKQGGAATIHRVRVTGDIQFESNSGALSAHENRVGGNLQAFRNRGGVRIAGNAIDGNLQCKENVPAPKGGNNLVKGSKEDQCRQL